MKKLIKKISSKPSDTIHHHNSKNTGNNINNIQNNLSNQIQPCVVVLNDIVKQRNEAPVISKDLGNGSKVNIFQSKLKRCRLKTQFVARDKAISTCSKRIYDCITPPGTLYVDCHSSNLIYLLTCSTCGFQYVGETVQQLNARFTGHRAGIKQPDKHGTCKILSNHFNQGVCKGATYTVQILEKLVGTGRTNRNAIDASITSYRKDREDYWIKLLRTAYPYGLNDRLSDDYMKDQDTSMIGLRFPPLKRSYQRLSRGLNRKGNTRLNHVEFLSTLDNMLIENLKDSLNFIRMSLSSMKKSELKLLGDNLNDLLLNKPIDFPFTQWYMVALDIIDCRIYKKPVSKPKRSPPSNILHIHFKNKGIEMVNLSSILYNAEVVDTIPSSAKTFCPPTIVYTLESPISTKIFNFNKFVTSLNVENIVKDNSVLPCQCASSPFSDEHHKHIISGDLRLIKNNKLRKLFAKGPKYRESKFIDWNSVEKTLVESVKNCAKAWCEKNRKSEKYLRLWITTVTEKIKSKISFLKVSRPPKRVQEVLKDRESMSALEELKKLYVIVPIDKASGNVAFVCKRFYALVLIKELGLDKDLGSTTYESMEQNNVNDIVQQQAKYLKKKFNLEVPTESKLLPHIYWLPKLHKNPVKFRFIIAAPNCSIKPLSKAITKIFKLFYKQIETYNTKSQFYNSIKTFWVIQNNENVIKSIEKLNCRNSAKSIKTFDFSTLYTKIPHHKLLDVLSELTDFCFQGGTHEQISVNNSGARWVSKNSKAMIRFNRNTVKDAIKYIMNNCHFTFGEKLFRQIVGIPMGSDPAPFMANLFLYYFESNWINNLKKESLQRARRFLHTFRFIDDLLTINDHGEFSNSFKEIYPPELQLNLEHSGNQVSFLDLQITNENGHLNTKLFDKRDDFPFSIVRLPFHSSNIPSKMFYSSIGAEILRIGRVCSSTDNFLLSCRTLIKRVKRQGAENFKLCKVIKKTYGRQQLLRQFSENAVEFANKILN